MTILLLGGLYGILTMWITGFIITFRKQLTCMVGMMAAMVLGMSVGLASGTLLTLWLPGQFFQSTLIGMLVGGSVGVLAGVPISLMAVIDGLLAGIMGGMMGTMLVVMMPAPYAGITIKIMSILCSGIVFLLLVMLQGEIKSDFLKQKSFLLSKPVIMFLVIGLTFVFILLSPTKDTKSEQHAPLSDPNSDYSVHNHSPSSTVVQELVVRATEFTFTPTSTRVVVGQKIKITLNNTGQEEHDFQIVGTNIHLHATPGKESSMIVSLDKAGYYQVICTLPGHKEAGMTASIQVINP